MACTTEARAWPASGLPPAAPTPPAADYDAETGPPSPVGIRSRRVDIRIRIRRRRIAVISRTVVAGARRRARLQLRVLRISRPDEAECLRIVHRRNLHRRSHRERELSLGVQNRRMVAGEQHARDSGDCARARADRGSGPPTDRAADYGPNAG